VPVTATLSRAFYDKFGDEVTNELVNWFNQVDLTYRTELRELNELNYARFEAKLDQRITELRTELRTELGKMATQQALSELRRDMEKGFSRLDAKLESTESRFDAKLEGMESRFDAKLEGMESRFDAKLESMESRFDAKLQSMEHRLLGRQDGALGGLRAELLKWMFGFWVAQAATTTGLFLALAR
jgi:DNA anti-recombination protein RmuC